MIGIRVYEKPGSVDEEAGTIKILRLEYKDCQWWDIGVDDNVPDGMYMTNNAVKPNYNSWDELLYDELPDIDNWEVIYGFNPHGYINSDTMARTIENI